MQLYKSVYKTAIQLVVKQKVFHGVSHENSTN